MKLSITNYQTGATIYSANCHSIKELVELAAREGADLSFADLSGVDLSGARLNYRESSGLRLKNALLCGTDFTDADLGKCDFSKANLAGTCFARADLHNAYLNYANCFRADFRDANLDVQCLHTNFKQASLVGAKINVFKHHLRYLEGAVRDRIQFSKKAA